MPRTWKLITLFIIAAALLTACSGSEWVSITPQALNTAAPRAVDPTVTAAPQPVIPSPGPTVPLPEMQATAEALVPVEDTPVVDSAAAQYVVVIVLDGFRPDYLELADMPNLRSLIDAGTSYSNAWVGALQNNTPPGHVMIATGSFPRRTGIIGHTWANLQTGESFDLFSLEAVQYGEADTLVQSSGVPTLAGLVKDRYPDEMVAAVSAQKFYAAQALGVGPADVLLYMAGSNAEAYTLPQTVQMESLRGRTPPGDFLADPDLRTHLIDPGDANALALLAATRLVERFQPRALLVNLPETDYYGHVSGKAGLAPVLEATDAALGDLMNSYRQQGLFERTLWVITADHGMTLKENIIVPADLYAQTGVETAADDATMLPEVRLTDITRAQPMAEALAASGADGLLGAYARVVQDGRYFYQAAPTTQASLPPALNDAFLYLLDTYAGLYSPDVVVASSGGAAFDETVESTGGTHNPINWADQHVLLVFSGAGVRPGNVSTAPARLIDILPTLARLMDLPVSNMDGIPLADALNNPLPEDVQQQLENINAFGPLRDALAATGQ